MDTLFAGLSSDDVWVTRMRAELSRAALVQDLAVEAAEEQENLSPVIQTTKWVGTQPACTPPPECYDGGNGSDDGLFPGGGSGEGCAVSDSDDGRFDDSSLISAALVGLGLAFARRRRRRRN